MLIRLQLWTLLFICLAAASCRQNLSSNSIETNQGKLSPTSNPLKSAQVETASGNSNKENLQAVDVLPGDKFPVPANGQCLADNAPRPPGVSENINVNEQSPMPETAEEFNRWLADLVGSQLVLDGRFLDISIVGDFNGDGCNDVAVPVMPDKNYEVVSHPDDPNAKARTNRNFKEYLANFVPCGIYLVNLQNDASELTCSKENLEKQNDFAKQFSTQSETAILIVHGGKKGWSWKVNADGRTALLLNIWNGQPSKEQANAIDFNIVSHGYKYDEYALPKTAKGDGIYLGLNSSASKRDKNKSAAGKLIYFDGKIYRAAKL